MKQLKSVSGTYLRRDQLAPIKGHTCRSLTRLVHANPFQQQKVSCIQEEIDDYRKSHAADELFGLEISEEGQETSCSFDLLVEKLQTQQTDSFANTMSALDSFFK